MADQTGKDTNRRRRPRWVPPLSMIGYGMIWAILAGYFVWICAEMAGHAISGAASVAAIFGGVGLGVVAGLLGMSLGRTQRDH